MTSEDRDYRVIALPSTCVGKKLKSFQLAKDGSYLFDEAYSNVYEVVQYKEENRSWFCGDIVVQDGSLSMITRVDPIFLLLDDLQNSQGVFKTLPDIIENKMGSDTLIKAFAEDEREMMSSVAQVKDLFGDVFYRLDEAKLIRWLKAKVEKVVHCLKAIGVDVSTRSTKVSTFSSGRKDESSEKEYIIYALHLLSKYLSDKHLKVLQEAYNVKIEPEPEPEMKTTPKGIKRNINESNGEKCEPLENYFSSESKTNGDAKKVKLNRSQKELMDASKKSGVRKIDQFFKKK